MPQSNSEPSKIELVVFCGFLMALSGFSVDVMLPAFTVMASDLDTPVASVQLTISVFAITFGLSQIVYGPVSDRFGRKPTLAVGLGIFLVGSVFAAFSTDIFWVLFGRALQGIGGAAAPVLGRAIVRDIHSGKDLARAVATMMTIFAIGPIVAPLVGYSLMASAGWRYIFLAMGILAFGLSLFNALRYRETIAAKNVEALNFSGIKNAISSVFGHWQSRYFMMCAALGYCALFTFLGNSPIVYETEFGVKGLEFSVLFSATAFGIVFGHAVNKNLIKRLRIVKMLRLSSLILFLTTTLMFILAFTGTLGPWSLTVLLFLFNTSFLSVISNSASLTMDPHPTHAGLASAVFGSLTSASGAIFLALTAGFVDGDAVTYAALMMLSTLATFAALMAFSPDKRKLSIE